MSTLTSEEIIDLTGKVRPAAQRKVLEHMGIAYKERPDGSIVVLRAMLEAVFGHATQKNRPASPSLRVHEARSLLLRQKGQVATAGR